VGGGSESAQQGVAGKNQPIGKGEKSAGALIDKTTGATIVWQQRKATGTRLSSAKSWGGRDEESQALRQTSFVKGHKLSKEGSAERLAVMIPICQQRRGRQKCFSSKNKKKAQKKNRERAPIGRGKDTCSDSDRTSCP